MPIDGGLWSRNDPPLDRVHVLIRIRSKIRSAKSGAIPLPLSETSMRTCSGCDSTRIEIRPWSAPVEPSLVSAESRTESLALVIRLISRTRSDSTNAGHQASDPASARAAGRLLEVLRGSQVDQETIELLP